MMFSKDIFDILSPQNWKELAGILFIEKMPMTVVAEQLLKLLEIEFPADSKERGAFLTFAIFRISSEIEKVKEADRILIVDPIPSDHPDHTSLEANCLTQPELRLLLRIVPTKDASGTTYIPASRKLLFNSSCQIVVKKHEEALYYDLPEEIIRILWDLRNDSSILKKHAIPSLAKAHESLVKKLCVVLKITRQNWTNIHYWDDICSKSLRKEKKKYVLSDPTSKIDKSKLISRDDSGAVIIPTKDQLEEMGITYANRHQ